MKFKVLMVKFLIALNAADRTQALLASVETKCSLHLKLECLYC